MKNAVYGLLSANETAMLMVKETGSWTMLISLYLGQISSCFNQEKNTR